LEIGGARWHVNGEGSDAMMHTMDFDAQAREPSGERMSLRELLLKQAALEIEARSATSRHRRQRRRARAIRLSEALVEREGVLRTIANGVSEQRRQQLWLVRSRAGEGRQEPAV
jgi:hypothetical protein